MDQGGIRLADADSAGSYVSAMLHALSAMSLTVSNIDVTQRLSKSDFPIFRLVVPDEFDPKRGWINIDSPMSKYLLCKEDGDETLPAVPSAMRSS